MRRFPTDFMFELSKNEWKELVTNCDHIPETMKHSYVPPFAFTEHGATMLSSILRSDVAIDASILVVRAFVAVRQFALSYAELNQKLETFMLETNMQFNEVYQALRELAEQKALSNKPMPEIGYTAKRYREKEE